MKLMYPYGGFTKEGAKEVIRISLQMRHIVMKQIKKLGSMEFYEVKISYITKY